MLTSVRIRPAPSIAAASSRSRGMAATKPISIQRQNGSVKTT
jgi:hypothetical protein